MPRYKNNDGQKKYFKEITDDYGVGSKINIELLINLKNAVSGFIEGDVLDIGNGGLINFDIDKASSVTLSDVVSDALKNPKIIKNGVFQALNEKEKEKFKFVQADTMNLPFPSRNFDRVLMFNVAHHLSVESAGDSLINIRRALAGLRRILRDDGILIIEENCPSFLIKIIQKMFYRFLFWFFKKFLGKPLPYFLDRKQIVSLLTEEGFYPFCVKEIEWGKRVYSPIIPNFIVPRWFWKRILRVYIFVSKKNN